MYKTSHNTKGLRINLGEIKPPSYIYVNNY